MWGFFVLEILLIMHRCSTFGIFGIFFGQSYYVPKNIDLIATASEGDKNQLTKL